MARVAVIDDPLGSHAALMRRAVLRAHPAAEIVWVKPDLALPQSLADLKGVVSVAVPVQVRGGHADDLFTGAIIEALLQLGRRGIRVFVACGNHRPNALTLGGVAVGPRGSTVGIS